MKSGSKESLFNYVFWYGFKFFLKAYIFLLISASIIFGFDRFVSKPKYLSQGRDQATLELIVTARDKLRDGDRSQIVVLEAIAEKNNLEAYRWLFNTLRDLNLPTDNDYTAEALEKSNTAQADEYLLKAMSGLDNKQLLSFLSYTQNHFDPVRRYELENDAANGDLRSRQRAALELKSSLSERERQALFHCFSGLKNLEKDKKSKMLEDGRSGYCMSDASKALKAREEK